ncbi:MULTISPECIES: capsid assembly protein [Thalassospira]|uniref:Uncharacterized protein n=1 Tax=Thalassospira tepidiphila TaxID=393657 RepID=A0ABX0X2I8_9PROT|nr:MULTISPECIES: hypothetical protein [Thalassospira]MBO6580947.1 hypothetical protein [Thalassospira sp.]MBO6805210.1 hypothetical protein [Thalassospira sp.]MBO6819751.1 hypothetical protein [Thalassospira sp.]MBO6886553.1 hypothetical protein [Thalassospira sp.]NJB75859.1 hypothetical protein [Thalassospira tepidiphila]
MTTEPDLLVAETETPKIPEAAETAELPDTETPAPETELDPAALADLVPETPDAYAITLADGMEDIDTDLNQRLHAAGFSNAQAQLVYDLAGEVLSPLLGDLDQAAQRATDRAALAAEFGGAESWKKLAPKIESWGKANLPEAAFETLCQSADGVRAMHRMMTHGDEAALGKTDGGAGETGLRSEIRRKMNDPCYWRDRDPTLVAEVQADFARLSGG